MSNRLTKTPQTWYVECAYCNSTNMGHERELRSKAKKLCKFHNDPDPRKRSYLLEYLESELDRLDHTDLSETRQIEILTTIHDQTGCTCLSELTAHIEQATQNSQNVTIPQSMTPSTTPSTQTTKTTSDSQIAKTTNNQHKLTPKRSTILDRIRAQQTKK